MSPKCPQSNQLVHIRRFKPLLSILLTIILQTNVAVQKQTKTVDSDVYTEAGDYIKDIEINDLRNRYTLTKGSFQKMVRV